MNNGYCDCAKIRCGEAWLDSKSQMNMNGEAKVIKVKSALTVSNTLKNSKDIPWKLFSEV